MKAVDLFQLIAWGAGTVAVGVALALVAMRLLRGRGLALRVSVVVLIPCLTALLGAEFGARAMFFSDHDRRALTVLLAAAGIVAALSASILATHLIAVDRALSAAEQARAVEASRSELMAWMSHDLRTPLAGMRAMAEALDDRVVAEPADVSRYHRQLRVEAARLTALVDDLFEISRTNHDAIATSLERVALGDLVSDAIAGLAPVAEAKGVRIVGRKGHDVLELDVAAGDLLRALRNVLENAIRFTPADGSVIVEVERRGDAAVVTVRDDGAGIAPAHLERVFEPGFRADPARTPGHAGGGLGLAIARGVVEAHHGEISVRNAATGGACVTIELPVAGR